MDIHHKRMNLRYNRKEITKSTPAMAGVAIVTEQSF